MNFSFSLINETPELIQHINSLENYFDRTYLLNKNKLCYNIIEKCVYDTAKFYCEKQNMQFDDIYIEYWIKIKIESFKFHIDCDENEKKNNNYIFPECSIITYLNDSKTPLCITNIDIEKYKYKEFENETEYYLFFPKKNYQLSFKGNTFHSAINIFDDVSSRYSIVVNLWKTRPSNITYFDKFEIESESSIDKYTENIDIRSIDISPIIIEEELQYSFFENILYKNDIRAFDKIVKKMENQDNFFVKVGSTENDELTQHNKICNDIKIMEKCEEINVNNRFLQRHIYKGFFTKNDCEWIILECNEFSKTCDWGVFRHKNYPTNDIPLHLINSVYKFTLFSLDSIFKMVFKSYNIDKSFVVNVKEIFAVRYTMDVQTDLQKHADGTTLSLNIMLSDSKSYEGGGTFFEDGTVHVLEQGDILVHSGYINHGAKKITKGERYVLVVFFDIINNTKKI